jgi:hypothetical protein
MVDLDVDFIGAKERATMSTRIDELADTISHLDPMEQKALLEKIAVRNFKRGLIELSVEYRTRLEREKKSNQTAEEILIELEKTREKAAHDDSYA